MFVHGLLNLIREMIVMVAHRWVRQNERLVIELINRFICTLHGLVDSLSGKSD